MRVISGTLKGKNVSFIKSSVTRPLKDSVKENIFNVISHSNLFTVKLEKSNILDLYSGIGSFGIECISRGAKKIFFVEKNKETAKILKKNLVDLIIKNKATVIVDKIMNFLKIKLNAKFDIIFLDPPFAEQTYVRELEIIREKKNL